MSWEKKSVPAPLIDGVEELATAISSVTQPVITLLDTASSALGAAKVFLTTVASPTTALALALIDEVQNLNNDIFGTGVYQLIVQPFDISNQYGVPLIGQAGPIDTEAKLFSSGNVSSPNDLGIPVLTPRRTIDKIIQSFDDEGDEERPQFSDNAEVSAFGFMIVAPDVEGFISLLSALNAVWEFGAFKKLLDDFLEKNNTATGGVSPSPSRKPDWDSVRFNSITLMKDTQTQLNAQLQFLRGLLGSTDDLLGDFLQLIERKIANLTSVIQDFNALIDTIKNATAASGIFVLDVPSGVGGNTRLKNEIDDEIFRDSKYRDNMAAAVIYVGGGPSLVAVESIRAILS